jgi:hypothetical protein
MQPFLTEDHDLFFGREEVVPELQRRLAAHPLLAVLGPSRGGKSSLVLAGLSPALAPHDGTDPLLERHFCPGDAPLSRLDAALQALGDTPGPIVVDQFEEIFVLCRDEAMRAAFVERLLALPAQRPVVLTMRTEFLGDCEAYPALWAALEAHQLPIAPLDAAELRTVMAKQAAAVGLRFEADLAATILERVQGEPGAMPLLQQTLRELWTRRHGRWLLAAEYRALGGVQGVIARIADTVYAGLTAPEKARMRDILVRLTRLDEDSARGTERRDSPRRVTLAELVPAGGDLDATRHLVWRLANAGLVITNGTPLTPSPAATPAAFAAPLIRTTPDPATAAAPS